MTTTTHPARRHPVADRPSEPGALVTARLTGLLYLGLAITGVIGFLVIRPQIVDDQAAVTLAQMGEHELLARVGIVFELGIVITQALAAMWFFRLFRRDDSLLAGALAAFGLINATIILAATGALATALDTALAPIPGAAGQVQMLTDLSANLWGVGAVFFGLWLIPMGLLARRAGMPGALGGLLVVGGVGYILSSLLSYLLPDAAVATELLTVPASIGEFWMIGYLLHGGVFRRR